MITDFKLTQIPKKFNEIKENNLYYDPDSLSRITLSSALDRIKDMPKRELKRYRKFMSEAVRTKDKEYVLNKVEKEQEKINKYLKK